MKSNHPTKSKRIQLEGQKDYSVHLTQFFAPESDPSRWKSIANVFEKEFRFWKIFTIQESDRGSLKRQN